MPSFCRKTSMSIKFLVLGGGGGVGFGEGGGSANFIFMGAGSFLNRGRVFAAKNNVIFWHNRKGVPRRGGTHWEPHPNRTQPHIDTYPRCSKSVWIRIEMPCFYSRYVEKPWARAPNAPLHLTRVNEHIFAVRPSAVPPFRLLRIVVPSIAGHCHRVSKGFLQRTLV